MRPASSTVCPLATAIELFTLRSETVGVSAEAALLVLLLFATWLISCSTSRRTLPLAFTRGMTRRMIPVSR